MKADRHLPLFEITIYLITFFVIFILGTIIFIILAGGLPYLGESLSTEETQFAIKMSLFTTTISTSVCLVLGIPTAYTLTKSRFPFKKVGQLIVELPLSLPYLVLGVSLLILFSSDYGKALKEMGFPVVFNQNGIIIAQTVVNLPYVIRLVQTAFTAVDSRLEWVAGSLGASTWERFYTITLPLSKNAILTAMILAWSRGMGEFGATLMLVGATRMKTETLTTSIYLNMAIGDNESAMAAATIILIISLGSQLLTNRLSQKTSNINRLNSNHK